MTNKQKIDYKAILSSLVYGDTQNIPDDEKQAVIDETPTEEVVTDDDGKGFVGIIFTIFKALAWIFGIFLIGVLLYFLYFKFVSRNKDQSFGDFVKKQSDDAEKDAAKPDDSQDILASMDDTSSDILSNIPSENTEKKEEIIQKQAPKQGEKKETLRVSKEASSSEITSKDEVPDWLKGNFSEPKKETPSKDEVPKPEEIPVPEVQKTEVKKEKTPPVTVKKEEVVQKKEVAQKTQTLEEDTALPKQDENIPDWLKGSFTEDSKTSADVEEKMESPKVENPKAENLKKDETSKTQASKSDEKVPDWLKGSMPEDTKKTENPKKEESPKAQAKTNTKEMAEVKTKDTGGKSETTKPAPKKKASPKKETKPKKEDELWDDGMKIPDWLKSDEEK